MRVVFDTNIYISALAIPGGNAEDAYLAGCGKTPFIHKMLLESSIWRRCQNRFRMLKKAVQQGRSERRGEAYASVR